MSGTAESRMARQELLRLVRKINQQIIELARAEA